MRSLILSFVYVATFAADDGNVNVRADKDHIEFRIGDELVGRYHKKGSTSPNRSSGLSSLREIFPSCASWPMEKGRPGESTDHVHQKSVWFCHGDVIPEGVELKHKVKGVAGVDFWSEHAGHGVIRCVEVDKSRESAMSTRNEWLTADGTKIMDENRVIRLHDLKSARLFVIEIDLQASVCPITFADTKEGSFGVRVHDALRVEKGTGRIENADGKVGESQCWGQKSAWCDYSGMIDGQTVGIAVFDDPANAHPACWHVRVRPDGCQPVRTIKIRIPRHAWPRRCRPAGKRRTSQAPLRVVVAHRRRQRRKGGGAFFDFRRLANEHAGTLACHRLNCRPRWWNWQPRRS